METQLDHEVDEKHAHNQQAPVRVVPANVLDVDQDDIDNPQMVAEYVEPILSYMFELEERLHVPADYIKIQQELNKRMRDVLVDWLTEVHHRFELIQETLHLTIHLLDRYLSKEPVTRDEVQLVGITAMMVAAKYEEMYPPELNDYVYITDNAYSDRRILDMERVSLDHSETGWKGRETVVSVCVCVVCGACVGTVETGKTVGKAN